MFEVLKADTLKGAGLKHPESYSDNHRGSRGIGDCVSQQWKECDTNPPLERWV